MLPALRRFVIALATRRGEAQEALCARADRIIHRAVNAALNEGANCDSSHLRVLMFAAAVQHHRAQLRREKFEPGQEPQRGAQVLEANVRVLALPGVGATQAALVQLPVESREVLLLVVLAQLSYVEVAQALDLSLGDAFARLTRARALFGAVLVQQERDAQPGAARSAGGQGAARRSGAQHLRLVK